MRLVRKAPCPDLAALIPDNDCRYMVLTRILRTPCRMTVTDDSNVILCHSAYPYPIWYWSKGEATDEEVDAVWQLLQPEIGKWDTVTEAGNPFSVNLLEDAAMHMIAHAKKDNVSLQVTRRLNAYECNVLVAPEKEVGGSFHICTEEDVDAAVELLERFHEDTGLDKADRTIYRQKAEVHIYAGRLFFWKNEAGVPVAMCAASDNGNGSEALTNVVTMPEHRRKGYASHLVATVTQRVLDGGEWANLYADADYLPSNACYEKIGYIRMGTICTIGLV
ncbi:MAG: GNAT family N-acetyltransferase [Lachnospiraceae bacterium]|nr:GNAT family N-acetyltransferase [Lachnospiraceae bacterium]